MQQHGSNYFTRRPPPRAFRRYGGWDQGVKIQNFQNMVKLHINLREFHVKQHGSKYLPPDAAIQIVQISLFLYLPMH